MAALMSPGQIWDSVLIETIDPLGIGYQDKRFLNPLIVLLGSGNYTGGAGRDRLANASKHHRPRLSSSAWLP